MTKQQLKRDSGFGSLRIALVAICFLSKRIGLNLPNSQHFKTSTILL